jgi:hypothetical protein
MDILVHLLCLQVVAYQYGRQSHSLLKELGADIEFLTYRGMGHSVSTRLIAPAAVCAGSAFIVPCCCVHVLCSHPHTLRSVGPHIRLRQQDCIVEVMQMPTLSLQACPQELSDIAKFLAKQLPASQ